MLSIDKSRLLCEPIEVDYGRAVTVLALGADLKSSVCLFHDGVYYPSKMLTGLSDPESYREFVETVGYFRSFLNKEPDLIVCDLHPGYLSSNYARSIASENKNILQVQHHHAHIAACALENNIDEPVIGIAADGTGYGTDGQIWGCEVLKCETHNFERCGHLKYFNLFGGDLAAIQTWRPAAGMLYEAFGQDFRIENIDPQALAIAKAKFKSQSGIIKTSSLGRLFDGISFLLGLCASNDIEAQAAIALEHAASKATSLKCLDYKILKDDNNCLVMDFIPLLKGIIDSRSSNVSTEHISANFHETICQMITDCVKQISIKTGITRVMLSGGCFFNKILLSRISELCKQGELEIYTHKLSMPGDGCIALGQAAVGVRYMESK